MRRNIRTWLANALVMMLLLQSATAGMVAANPIVPEPEPIQQVLVEDSEADTENTVDADDVDGEDSADADSEPGDAETSETPAEGEGDPGDGDDLVDGSTEGDAADDAVADDNNADGEEREIAGPTLDEEVADLPTNAPANVVRPMAIVGPGVTGVTVTPTVLDEICDPVRANGTWAVGEDSRTGDTFTLNIDSRLNVAPGVRDLYVAGEPQTPENLVAKMSVSGNIATFIMQVDGANGGTFYLDSSGCWGQNFAGQDVVLEFTGSGSGSWPNTVTVPSAPLLPPNTNASKSGSFTDDETITWRIQFPSGPSQGATITDAAQAGWVFDLDSFNASNAGGSEVALAPGSTANSITVTTGDYASGQPAFTINATLDPAWESLDLPVDWEGRTVFSNSFTGTNTGENGDDATISGSATAPKPLPPPVYPLQPNPTKTGTFTRPDQGRLNPEGAIEWTVYFPAGSSNGSTITDSAGEGWTFDLASFEPINRSGGTVTLDETSTVNQIKVNVGAYSHETNAPGFKIRATITDPNKTSFDNVATSVSNPVLGGGPINGTTPEIEVPRTEIPSVSNEPNKSGTFTGDETITWTIHFPAGSSGGATITDIAGTGWVFDTSTFSATNRGGSDVVLAQGSNEDSITVTSGVYIAGTEGPSFTIQAKLVDGWEELGIPTDDTGRFVFSNTVSVSNIPYGGGDPVTGTKDAYAPKPLPPAPPETGTNPTKTGEWTSPDDQGAITPNGAIKWTVKLPHGPASGAVITDHAQDGWEFDCDSFTPADHWTDGENISMVDECTPQTLKVTVGAYGGDQWYVPQYSINANITATPSHVNGRGFNNTVTSVVTDVTGQVTKSGTSTTGWLVQQSGFGGDGRTYTIPVSPTINDAVCVDGVEPNPSIQLPTNAFGLTYSVVDDSNLATTGEYSIKATKAETHQWGMMPEGWSIDEEDESVAIYVGQVDILPCEVEVEPITPVTPAVGAAVCDEVTNEPIDPTVTIDDERGYITYDITATGGEVTGTATITHDAYVFVETDPIFGENSPWSYTSPTVATYSDTYDVPDCTPIEEVTLILPAVKAHVCEGGIEPSPSIINVPAFEEGDAVEYTIVRDIDDAGNFQVVAELRGEYVTWPTELPANIFGTWDTVATDPTQLVFNGSVDIVPCIPVELVLPAVEAAVCEGGIEPSPSIINVPAFEEGDAVEYTIVRDIDDDGNFQVVVELRGEHASWPTELPFNEFGTWETVATHPTQLVFNGSVDIVPCIPVELVLPAVEAAVCEGGVEPSPSIINVPAFEEGDAVEYTIVRDIDDDGNFQVVVELRGEHASWPTELPFNEFGAWETVATHPTQLVFNGSVDIVPCVPVDPILPVVEGNVCEGGFYTDPVVSFGEPNENIEYSNGVAQGGQVTAQARLATPGTAWGELPWDDETNTGWYADQEDATLAHFVGTYVEAPCAPVVPAMPVVQEAICTGGELIDPIITINDTDRIKYTKSGEEVSGGTVIITATLENGFEWDDDMPEGWTVNPEDPAEATYVVELADIDCTPVVPALPTVTPAVCEDGTVTPPTVAVPTTPGITYTKSGEEVPGGTVIITATVEPGYGFGDLPEGWTQDPNDPIRATYTVELEDVECTPVVPEAPVITPAVCEDGTVTPPTVELPSTPGVTYTKSGEEVPGGKVTITATLEPGYEWGELPEGWTIEPNDPTKAIFTVTLPAAPECDPADEKPVEVVELPSTGSGSETTGLGMMVASIFGLMAAALALRMNAFKRS